MPQPTILGEGNPDPTCGGGGRFVHSEAARPAAAISWFVHCGRSAAFGACGEGTLDIQYITAMTQACDNRCGSSEGIHVM